MTVTWIEHWGKPILLVDYRGLKGEETLDTLEAAAKYIFQSQSKILILVDITDAFMSPEFMVRAKALGKQSQSLIDKQAIVGVTGIKRVLVDAYNRFVPGPTGKSFATQEEAKAWLVT